MEVVNDAGIEWQLARVWAGGRERERQLKRQGGASRHCPVCKGQPPDLTAAYTTAPAHHLRRARAAQPAAEPEPLWESIAAYLTEAEAAALLGELQAAEDTAWQAAAAAAWQHHSAALDMACDLSRLRSAESSAIERLAEARAIALREGWAEADLHPGPEPEPVPDQHSAGRTQPAPTTPQQEGPQMGNFTDERETIDSARDAGAEEARAAAAAAIGSGRYDPERLDDWAWGAAEGLHGTAISDADRAFADGFERAAVKASADYERAGQELAACFREPGSPHPDPDLAARGWHVSECGVYSRARARDAELAGAPAAAVAPDLEREAG
jgi:hypothetical protein